MSLVARLCERHSVYLIPSINNLTVVRSVTKARIPNTATSKTDKDGFRILELIPKPPEKQQRIVKKIQALPPRMNQMAVDQDWTSVWPGQRTFHPASVPLPVRQGYPKKNEAPPSKYGNAELMKIPNFLHLTPPTIKRHCEALKKFCTKWPEELDTDISYDKHFPLEVIYSNYCYSGPSIREPMARIVSFRVKLSNLTLDQHAKDKILRLVGERYDPESDLLTIVADRCPIRKQNYEYAEYLLTALYHESWRKEEWENEKTLADMEYYDWDLEQSRKNLVTVYAWPEIPQDYDYENIPNATEYKIAVSDLVNNGEDDFSVNKYKEAVKKIMFWKPDGDKPNEK
ncbi:28S ribosomal protein S35, mitochondrial [Trichogramma pretiosum]|uniref:28S ribosomal protein S35, mitochondrial n=1 Tax=Trichogramma pretiosum TaxID=7493 RepID=UPI0006C942BC|nr:28S ribosomal protein S35, mitochondrial [Trichogramma pretiosum]